MARNSVSQSEDVSQNWERGTLGRGLLVEALRDGRVGDGGEVEWQGEGLRRSVLRNRFCRLGSYSHSASVSNFPSHTKTPPSQQFRKEQS
jgi:hypothetical protein